MARRIRIDETEINEAVDKFREAISKESFSDGKLKYELDLGNVDAKAKLTFSETAYLKMWYLVAACDKEIAWHCTAHRGEEEHEYHVDDVFVYPQVVSGATVNTDQEKYQDWLYGLDDDVFNNLRLQGHSHVNMSTTPSAVDNTLYDRLRSQLEGDMFYIFLIWNKRGEHTISIYDYRDNVVFSNSDIELFYEGDFVSSASDRVKENIPAPVVQSANVPFTQNKNTPTQTTKKSNASSYYDDDWDDYYGHGKYGGRYSYGGYGGYDYSSYRRKGTIK